MSKWENGNAMPDITLLPDIARYFGITIDELLQTEKIDEEHLYAEYEKNTCDLFRNGQYSENVAVWEEAFRKMPNNVNVKEMLMSAYFDADKAKYQNEIVALGTELYNSDTGVFFKGQAITQVARTYAENGDMEMADKWASKSYQLMHSQEMIFMQILNDCKKLNEYFRFANHWYLDSLFYMAMRLNMHSDNSEKRHIQNINKSVAQIFETVYPNDDMSFESLKQLYVLHRCIAEDEAALGMNEDIVKKHLQRALDCAVKSITVEEHELTHPLVYGWQVAAAPVDSKQIIRLYKAELGWECFNSYRQTEWFKEIEEKVYSLI